MTPLWRLWKQPVVSIHGILFGLCIVETRKKRIFFELYIFVPIYSNRRSKWGITTYWCLSLGLVSILPQKQLEWMVFYEKYNIHSAIGQWRKFNFPWIRLFRLWEEILKRYSQNWMRVLICSRQKSFLMVDMWHNGRAASAVDTICIQGPFPIHKR